MFYLLQLFFNSLIGILFAQPASVPPSTTNSAAQADSRNVPTKEEQQVITRGVAGPVQPPSQGEPNRVSYGAVNSADSTGASFGPGSTMSGVTRSKPSNVQRPMIQQPMQVQRPPIQQPMQIQRPPQPMQIQRPMIQQSQPAPLSSNTQTPSKDNKGLTPGSTLKSQDLKVASDSYLENKQKPEKDTYQGETPDLPYETKTETSYAPSSMGDTKTETSYIPPSTDETTPSQVELKIPTDTETVEIEIVDEYKTFDETNTDVPPPTSEVHTESSYPPSSEENTESSYSPSSEMESRSYEGNTETSEAEYETEYETVIETDAE